MFNILIRTRSRYYIPDETNEWMSFYNNNNKNVQVTQWKIDKNNINNE